MIHVYIAGKFTAPTEYEIDLNILAAEAVERAVLERTERVVCLVPHSLGRNFKRGPGSAAYWYEATLSILKRCDVLLLVPGWENSTGTLGEVQWCKDHGVHICETVDELLTYVEARWMSERGAA